MLRSRKTVAAAVSAALAAALWPVGALAVPDTSGSQAELADAQARISQLGGELVAINEELESASLELERTDNLIERISSDQEQTAANLELAKEVLMGRMRSSYKTGGFNVLEFLFGSKSIDELLSRFYYVERASRGDAEAIAQVTELSDQLESQRSELETKRDEQLSRVQLIESQAANHAALVEEARSYYNQLDSSVREELARQAAAEAAAQAQQQEAAQASDQSAAQDAPATAAAADTATTQQQATAAVMEAITQSDEAPASQPSDPEPAPETETSEQQEEQERQEEPAEQEEQESSAETPSSSSDEPFAGGGLASAYSCLGWPYVWGGYLPSMGGFDCSGLVSYCFGDGSWRRGCESMGNAIINAGLWKSSIDELVPGDLVFTDSEFNHVQIYAGNGQVIHAPYPGRVVCLEDIYSFYGGGPFVMP